MKWKYNAKTVTTLLDGAGAFVGLTQTGPEVVVGFRTTVTEEGINYLSEHASWVIRMKEIEKKYILKLIRFLPQESLPKYLASDDEKVRQMAKARVLEIGQGYEVLFKDPVRIVHMDSPDSYDAENNVFLFQETGEWGTDIRGYNDCALIHEAEEGDPDAVELLLKTGMDVNKNDSEALRMACKRGYEEVVKLLIEQGADIHADYDEALKSACDCGSKEVVQLLIDNGADIHANEGFPLRIACDKGAIEIVELLLDNGANVHAHAEGALRIATIKNNLPLVNLLLEHGADPTCDVDTSLREAIKNESIDIVKSFIHHGAAESFAYIKRKISLRETLSLFESDVINEALAKGWEPFSLEEAIDRWIERMDSDEETIGEELTYYLNSGFPAVFTLPIYETEADNFLIQLEEN